MKTKIFIDFDNTLVDSTSAFVKVYNNMKGTSIDAKKIIHYDFTPELEISKEEIIKIFSSDELFDNLVTYEGVRDVLTKLKESKLFQIYLITNCSAQSVNKKVQWLVKNNLDQFFDGKIYLDINRPYDKSLIDMSKSIFIDDHRENHLTSNAKYKFSYKDYSERTWYPTSEDDVLVFQKWNSGLVEYFKYIARHNK